MHVPQGYFHLCGILYNEMSIYSRHTLEYVQNVLFFLELEVTNHFHHTTVLTVAGAVPAAACIVGRAAAASTVARADLGGAFVLLMLFLLSWLLILFL